MRTKRRWLSESKLIVEIDRQRERSIELIQAGTEEEKRARGILRDPLQSSKHKDARAGLQQALKTIGRGELIRDSRLPNLGKKLAELRTDTMPFVDQTVPR